MSISEVVGADKVRKSAAWKVFGWVTSVAALITTGQQLWAGDEEWVIVGYVNKLWAFLLPAVAWLRGRWEENGIDGFIPILLVGAGATAAFQITKSARASSKARDMAMKRALAAGGPKS